MDYEFYGLLFGLTVVFGWAGLAILAKYLRNKQRARYREMIHKERMVAVEKGIPRGQSRPSHTSQPLLTVSGKETSEPQDARYNGSETRR